MNNYAVTIIVCTYNRAQILQECLHSLARQTSPSSVYEVLVVDNNSSDSTIPVCNEFIESCTNFRLVSEPEQGLSHARNRGWQASRSDWVAYIDDDAKAMPDYVKRILHVIGNYPFDCFGGVYLPWYRNGKPRWFRDSYACASNAFVQDSIGPIAEGFFASGGNFIIKRSLLERFGGFSPDFGMRGGDLTYGEETQLQMRMKASGLTIGFDPELLVHHLVSEYKMNPLWLLKFQYASARDAAMINGAIPTWKDFARIIFNAGKHTARSLAVSTTALMRDDYFMQNWFLDVFQPLAGYSGRFVGTLTRYVGHWMNRGTL